MTIDDRVFLLQWCSRALLSLQKNKVPTGQEEIPDEVCLYPSLSEEKIVSRVQRIVQNAFDEDFTTPVQASDFALFLERWKTYVTNSSKFSKKGRAFSSIAQLLFSNNLCYSPVKLIEVLQGRDPKSLSGFELRALERALCVLWGSYDNFRAILYFFYLSYLGDLLGSRIESLGAKVKIKHGTDNLVVDWEAVPFFSPEAITLAARFQRAQKFQTTEKLLEELSQDFSSFNEESQKIIAICTMDFLWDRAMEVSLLFKEYVTYESLQDLENESVMLPASIKQALEALDVYWDVTHFEEARNKEVYNSTANLKRKAILGHDLIECAHKYILSLRKEVLLPYECGYKLYCPASKMQGYNKEVDFFIDPKDFSKDEIFVSSLEALNTSLPTTVKDIVAFALTDSTIWPKAFFSRIFGSSEIADKLIDSFFNIPEPQGEAPSLAASEPSSSSSAPQLFKPSQTKGTRPQVSKLKKKKATSSVREITKSMRRMVLSPPLPPSKQQQVDKGPSEQGVESKIIVEKVASPPVMPRTVWVAPNIIEGNETEILGALGFPPVEIHEHVINQFGIKRESAGEIPWDIQCHTYPVFIARLIQQFSNSWPRPSPRRQCDDTAFSCVGSWDYYGKRKKAHYVGYFTEGFFSKTNIDGPEGMLFHHCFCQTSSAQCIERFENNSRFHADKDIDDILEIEKKKSFALLSSNIRFRVTINPYCIMVNDTMQEVLYTLGFWRKISLK